MKNFNPSFFRVTLNSPDSENYNSAQNVWEWDYAKLENVSPTETMYFPLKGDRPSWGMAKEIEGLIEDGKYVEIEGNLEDYSISLKDIYNCFYNAEDRAILDSILAKGIDCIVKNYEHAVIFTKINEKYLVELTFADGQDLTEEEIKYEHAEANQNLLDFFFKKLQE